VLVPGAERWPVAEGDACDIEREAGGIVDADCRAVEPREERRLRRALRNLGKLAAVDEVHRGAQLASRENATSRM
jgi:hypothetical protein